VSKTWHQVTPTATGTSQYSPGSSVTRLLYWSMHHVVSLS